MISNVILWIVCVDSLNIIYINHFYPFFFSSDSKNGLNIYFCLSPLTSLLYNLFLGIGVMLLPILYLYYSSFYLYFYDSWLSLFCWFDLLNGVVIVYDYGVLTADHRLDYTLTSFTSAFFFKP